MPLVSDRTASPPVVASAIPVRQTMRWEITAAPVAIPVLVAWISVAFLLLARLAVSWRKLVQLKRTATPAADARQQRFDILRAQVGLRRVARLGVSDRVHTPLAAGLRQPMVLLPAKLAGELTDAEFDAVIVHELAHLRRWDDWTNLLQQAVQAAFWLNPVVWFMGRQIALHREIACDDWVIAATGQPKDYATCLTRLMELARPPRLSLPAPGAWMTRGQLTRRVMALLDKRRNAAPRGSLGWTAFSLALMALLVAAALRWGPTIALAAEPAAPKALPAQPVPAPPAPKAQPPRPPSPPSPAAAPSAAEPVPQPPSATSLTAKQRERDFVLEEIALVEQLVDTLDKQFKLGRTSQEEVIKAKRDLIVLRRQLTVLDEEIPWLTKNQAAREKYQAEQNARSEAAWKAQSEQANATLAMLVQTAKADSDASVRLTAIEGIGRLGLTNGIPPLLEIALGESDWMLRRAALTGLARVRAEEATRAFVRAYEHFEDATVRAEVVAFLCRRSDDLSIQALQRIAREDPDARCRAYAVGALSGGQMPDPASWSGPLQPINSAPRPAAGAPVLNPATSVKPVPPQPAPVVAPAVGPDTEARRAEEAKRKADQALAAAETKRKQAEVLPRLVEIAKTDSDPKVRLSAVGRIAATRSDEAVDLLAYLAVYDPDASVRRNAFGVLAGIHTPAATQAKLKLLEIWKEPEIRSAVVYALAEAKVIRDGPHDMERLVTPESVVNTLKEVALKDNDTRTRRTAIQMLRSVQGETGVQALLSLYESIKDHDTRRGVIEELGLFSGEASKARLLEIAKSDPDPNCRVTALESLRYERRGPLTAGQSIYQPGTGPVPPAPPKPAP